MPKLPTYIDFIVGPSNSHLIEVVNGDGKTCTSLTAPFEQVTGEIAQRDFKPEHQRAQLSVAATARVSR